MQNAVAYKDNQDELKQAVRSSLISRNITLHGRRTSMRLEPAMWDALYEIARREKLNIHQLCTMVSDYKGENSSFTAAIRVFAMSYFRVATTEEGHRKAGHGSAFLFSKEKDFAPFLREGAQQGIAGALPHTV